MFKKEDIHLVQTCSACPEQYDAFVGDEIVGYLRLRWGHFTVSTPDAGGKCVLSATPNGDGCFDPDEREHYLDLAKRAIVIENSPREERDPTIEGWRAAVAAGETLFSASQWIGSE